MQSGRPTDREKRSEGKKGSSIPPPPFSKMREFGGCCRMLLQHRKSGAIAWRAIQAATTPSGMQATMQDFFSIVGGLLLSFSQTSIEAKVKLPG